MGGKKKEQQAKEPEATDAVGLKNAGNVSFQAGKYLEAAVYFTKAIEVDNTQAAFFSNRAFCYYNLSEFKKGVEDADQAIALDSKFAKAYLRKAHCLMEATTMEDWQQKALTTCQEGMAVAEDESVKGELLKVVMQIKKEMNVAEQNAKGPRYANQVAFEKWIKEKGVTGYPDNLHIRWISAGNWTNFATRDLKAGEVMAVIPIEIVVGNTLPSTIDNPEYPVTKAIYDSHGQGPLARNILSAWMLENIQNGASFRPYFEMFHTMSNLPACYSQDENNFLQGTWLQNECGLRTAQIKLQHQALTMTIPEFKIELDQFHGHSLLLAGRQFCPEENRLIGNKFLIPLMDLCNHASEAQSNCEFKILCDIQEGKRNPLSIQMVAKKAIKRGEGITSYYGTYNNYKWLQEWGMVIPDNQDHNVVQQYIDLPKEPLYEEKLTHYPKNEATIRPFKLNQNLDFPQMMCCMSYIRFCMYDGAGFDPEYLQTRVQWGAECNTYLKTSNMQLESFPVVSYDNELKTIDRILVIVKKMLTDHPMTIDQAQMFYDQNEAQLTLNLKNIINFVQSEKKTLMAIIEILEFCMDLMNPDNEHNFETKTIPHEYEKSSAYIKTDLIPLIKKHYEDKNGPKEDKANRYATKNRKGQI